MNKSILQQYGLVMKKSRKRFKGTVEGFLAPYLSIFNHPDDVQDMIDDVDRAINGQFNQIDDPDYGAQLEWIDTTYWFATITPSFFEIRHMSQDQSEKLEIPLKDWREILVSWKDCLE